VRQQSFEQPAAPRVLADGLGAVEQASERVARLTKDLTELVEGWSTRPLVTAFEALRGVQVVSAAILAAECRVRV
jgi:hypothetical protein